MARIREEGDMYGQKWNYSLIIRLVCIVFASSHLKSIALLSCWHPLNYWYPLVQWLHPANDFCKHSPTVMRNDHRITHCGISLYAQSYRIRTSNFDGALTVSLWVESVNGTVSEQNWLCTRGQPVWKIPLVLQSLFLKISVESDGL